MKSALSILLLEKSFKFIKSCLQNFVKLHIKFIVNI